jgi:hypothetical protein
MTLFAATAAHAAPVVDVCQSGSLLALTDGVAGVPSPCVLGAGTFLVQSLYFQNASKVGGSALAEYPMFNLRAGIGNRLELSIDTPSQVAYSGSRGAGLYILTHPGGGVLYRLTDSSRLAVALGATISPPVQRFEPVLSQPRYAFDLSSTYRLDDHFALDAAIMAHTSRSIGFNQMYPGGVLGLTYTPDRTTQLATSIGTRVVAHGSSLQRYGDVSVTHLLAKNVSVDVGLGTAFNPVADTKSHYLGAGLNFRP